MCRDVASRLAGLRLLDTVARMATQIPRLAAVVVLAPVLAACGTTAQPSTEDAPAPKLTRVSSEYVLHFDHTFDDYSEKASGAAARCRGLPGAHDAGGNYTSPPQLLVGFFGTADQQRLLVDCLARVPGAHVAGVPAAHEHRMGARFDRQTFDPELTGAAVDACAALPGVAGGIERQSLPPLPTWSFTGSIAEQTAFERCLREIPSVTSVSSHLLDRPDDLSPALPGWNRPLR